MYIVQVQAHDIWHTILETKWYPDAKRRLEQLFNEVDNPNDPATQARLDYDPHYIPL